VEENNQFETNTDGSKGGSLLYDEKLESQQQGEESGYSSVYSTGSQSTQTTETVRPVQLTKPSKQEPTSQPTMSVQLTKPPESVQQQQTVPIPQAASVPPGYNQQIGQNPYGQPSANPMGFGPMQGALPVQGAPPAKPKKNKAGLVVGILCAAAVVIVIVMGVLITKSLFGNDPEKQLAKGIANMTEEMAAYRSSAAEDIGIVELNQLKDTQPVHTNIDLSFTDPNATGSITNIDIELDGITDYKNKMAEYDVSAGTYGINMNIGKVVAADNTLYVSVPMIFHDEVYSLELTNLGKNFNDSAWSTLMDETLPEDYSLTLFDDAKAQDSKKSELQKIFQKQSRANADAVTYEVIEKKKELAMNGASAEYGGVRVTMDKDVYNESMEAIKNDFLASDFYETFMEGYQTTYADDFDTFKEDMDDFVEQLFGIRFEQNPVIDFYLDSKGRIVNISTPEDIAVSGKGSDVKSIAIDISFAGTQRTLDSIEGGIYVQVGDEILYMGISRTASITKDVYNEDLTLRLQDNISDDEITFWYTNQWGYNDQTFDLQMSIEIPDTSMEISADGGFKDIVKGERYMFEINHGTITMNGEDLLLMTGSIETELSDSAIEVPEHATNILEMSTSEITDLLYDTLY